MSKRKASELDNSTSSSSSSSSLPDNIEINRLTPFMLGVDEAGRGPVLGSMIYAYAACPLSLSQHLASLGFADSKTLTASKRDDLLQIITQNSAWLHTHFISLSAREISDQQVRTQPVSLNAMAHETTFALIQHALDKGLRIKQVFIDTVGDPASYKKKLESRFSDSAMEFTVTSKADSLFPVVSAASIVAKTRRDHEMESFVFEEVQLRNSNRNWGSGYPADPETKSWLASSVHFIFGWPTIVRFGWATSKNLIKDKCAHVTWYDDCDEDWNEASLRIVEGKQSTLDDAFGTSLQSQESRITRAPLFKQMNLHLVRDL